MPIATLTFANPLNSSLQIGDIVYYSTPGQAPSSSFSTSVTGGMTKLGAVFSMSIDPIQVGVFYTDAANGGVNPPASGDYIMFEKDKQVFSLGSEVSESSK